MELGLLNVIGRSDLDKIVQAMADRRLLHLPGACAMPPAALLSAGDLERLLLLDGIDRSLGVWVNGRQTDLEMMGAARNGRLRHLALRKLMRQGASVIVNEIERYLPRFWSLACDAERLFQDRIRAVAVSSSTKIPALVAHYDPWDLIVVQTEGTKLWRLFGEPTDCGTAKHPAVYVPEEVSATVTMRQGDILFVPTGLHHRCEADGFSLHVTLAVERATMRDLFEDLFKSSPTLHRPLRAVLGDQAIASQIEAVRKEFEQRLAEVNTTEWLANWNAGRARVTHLDLRGEPAVEEDCVASLAITMIPGGSSGGRLRIGGAEFDPSLASLAILRQLKHGPIELAELWRTLPPEVTIDEARSAHAELSGKGVVRLQSSQVVAPVALAGPATHGAS